MSCKECIAIFTGYHYSRMSMLFWWK